MFDYKRGQQLSGEARQAYIHGNLKEAVDLATQALMLIPWGDPEHYEAGATLKFAQRRLDHPNPSWLRRVWWVIDGEWAFVLASGVSLEDNETRR